MPPPSSTQILVVGGGPAGSYAATVLAREGFDVVLLEASKFPRYHIGESLLPSIRPFLKFIDAEGLVERHGFTIKRGVATKLSPCKREGYSDFLNMSIKGGAWNVIRSEFDELLLNYAAASGAAVFQETKVTSIQFVTSNSTECPISASWKHSISGLQGEIKFDFIVDASGRNGIMSTKYLGNRILNHSLDNIASWGYWTNTKSYMPGTPRDNAIWLEALNDESGWVWFIPLHNGTTSIGIVMQKSSSSKKRRTAHESGSIQSLEEHYLTELKRAPGVIKLIGDGHLCGAGTTGAIRVGNDQSYSAASYGGPHYRIAGDAGAFIDPFFSSGVHLALTGALSAAASISASIRGHVSESHCIKWHQAKVGTSYTRFLIVVLGTYKQMCHQDKPIMCEIDEDNFDKAFDFIRPVIQGTADVGKRLTEDELVKTMEFCRNIFAPTTPEMYESVSQRIDPELMSPNGTLMTPEDLDRLLDPGDYEAKLVLSEINSRKAVHPMYDAAFHFGHEILHGLTAVIKRHGVGLVPVEQQ